MFRDYERPPGDLPRVRRAATADRDALREAAAVVAALPADLAERVDHVEVATVDQIALVLRDGRRVEWGSAEESEEKAEVLAALLEQREAKAYDVSVPGQPTITQLTPRRRLSLVEIASTHGVSARVRRAVVPTVVDQREVDITITLRFRVRVPARAAHVSAEIDRQSRQVASPPSEPPGRPVSRTRSREAHRRGSSAELPGHHQGRRHRWRWRQRRQPDDRGRPQGRRVHRDQHRRPGPAHERRRRQARHRPRAHPRPRRRRQPRRGRPAPPRTTPTRSRRSSRAPTWSS